MPHVRTYIRELAERHPCQTGNTGAEAERQRIDPRGSYPHRLGHIAVLRHRANMQPKPSACEHACKRDEHEQREHDDV